MHGVCGCGSGEDVWAEADDAAVEEKDYESRWMREAGEDNSSYDALAVPALFVDCTTLNVENSVV